MKNSKPIVHELLESAGITVNGDNPWDIHIYDDRTYNRLLRDASHGLGESYMDGWWDCQSINAFIDRVLRADLRKKVENNWRMTWHVLKAWLINQQSMAKAGEVAERHYDFGDDLYRAMLDKRPNYTCAYWKNAQNLDDAQEAKLELVCRKIGTQKDMKILELG